MDATLQSRKTLCALGADNSVRRKDTVAKAPSSIPVTVEIDTKFIPEFRDIEGTPERPSNPRNMWEFEIVAPVSNTNKQGRELVVVSKRVVGEWRRADDLPDYQCEYVPRDPRLHPIQSVTLNYFDDDGSLQNEMRKPSK